MWQTSTSGNGSEWLQSKHIFVGESRIATKSNKEIAGKTEGNLSFEMEHQYWYHSDHLGSAQLTTSRSGELHERIEYTPYGEIWVEHRYDLAEGSLPYRFTGKELDEETGYYYYGARYLDPRTSRWISTDPAVGDYVPSAPVDDEAKKRNGNLPGMGGVFNVVNLHVYHYAGNNPVALRDPDGRIIMTPALLYRQSDARYKNEPLGGVKTYDDAAGTKLNSIGLYGCLYMASASVGLSIRTNNGTRLSGVSYTDISAIRSKADVEKYINPFAGNEPNNFIYSPSGNGGVDVKLNNDKVKNIIQSMSGKNISIDYVESGFADKLKSLNSDSKSYFVIAEFSTGPNPWDKHFGVLDGITENADGSVSLNYREQFKGFENTTFTIDNINSLRVVDY
jgi:RHS repeat-associated protein